MSRDQRYGPTPISRTEAMESVRKARAEIDEAMKAEVDRDAAAYADDKDAEIASLRAQLAAAEEKIPTLEKANMGEFMGHPFSYWLALDNLAARDMLHHGDVVGEVAILRAQLAAEKAENKRVQHELGDALFAVGEAPRNDGLDSMLAAARADAAREFANAYSKALVVTFGGQHLESEIGEEMMPVAWLVRWLAEKEERDE